MRLGPRLASAYRAGSDIGSELLLKCGSLIGAGLWVPELGHRAWPGFLCGPLVLVDEAAKDGPALDVLLGEVRGRV